MRRQVHQIQLLVASAIAIAACSVTPEPEHGVLDARLAGPCERLVVAWSMDVSRLHEFVAVEAVPRSSDGVGELQLSVLNCRRTAPSGSKHGPLLYAYLSAAVLADSVPLVITNIPADGWRWSPSVIANAASSNVFSDMGYSVSVADIDFDVSAVENDWSIDVRLAFDGGEILIVAKTEGEAVPYDARRTLLSSGADILSAYFGRETGTRYASATANVRQQGNTPLASFLPTAVPVSAMFDTALRPDRVLWRLPQPQR